MDEPLSNLDAKLRVQTRAEILRLHQRLKTTVIYVTHDQVEAMTMGDRIAVMRDGVLQQVGTPEQLYEYPANIFVAGFIGSPAMNFVTATDRWVGLARRRAGMPLNGKAAEVMAGLDKGTEVPSASGRSTSSWERGTRRRHSDPGPRRGRRVPRRRGADPRPGGRCRAPGRCLGSPLAARGPGRVLAGSAQVHLFDPTSELALLHWLP